MMKSMQPARPTFRRNIYFIISLDMKVQRGKCAGLIPNMSQSLQPADMTRKSTFGKKSNSTSGTVSIKLKQMHQWTAYNGLLGSTVWSWQQALQTAKSTLSLESMTTPGAPSSKTDTTEASTPLAGALLLNPPCSALNTPLLKLNNNSSLSLPRGSSLEEMIGKWRFGCSGKTDLSQ